MTLNTNLIEKLEKITSKSAIAVYNFIGKNDKIAADKAAVDVMRRELNNLDIKGKVVIGEGELDEAPMLYIGEQVGSGHGLHVDIAVDPVEGTNFVAKNLPGGLSVLAVSEKGNLFNAPETYMEKIAVGSDVPEGLLDLDYSVKENIKRLAKAKCKDIKSIVACILDRPRHLKIIEELMDIGVSVKLISDGDVAGALLVSDQKYNVDIYLGTGGGPEGVLAAAALDAYGCKFQCRFLFENDEDIRRAKKMGINDLNKKYNLHEIIKGDTIFCATGITNGDLVNGVTFKNNKFYTETLVTHKNSSNRIIKSETSKT